MYLPTTHINAYLNTHIHTYIANKNIKCIYDLSDVIMTSASFYGNNHEAKQNIEDISTSCGHYCQTKIPLVRVK